MREIIAGFLLISILVLSVVNTGYVERKTKALIEDVSGAQNEYFDGNHEEAAEIIEESRDVWLDWNSYAHIMLRHTEIDLVTDAFFELLSALESDSSVSEASFEKLREMLRSIAVMERISFGSVL